MSVSIFDYVSGGIAENSPDYGWRIGINVENIIVENAKNTAENEKYMLTLLFASLEVHAIARTIETDDNSVLTS